MSDYPHVTAMILGGGQGTRLRKVVQNRPKVIVEIKGKPFLLFLLDQLEESGIRHVIICTGYMGSMIEDIIGYSYKGLVVDYSWEETPHGTAGALKLAGNSVNTKYCLVMNGDSYTELDLVSLLKTHEKSKAKITIVCKIIENSNRFGLIEMNKNNEIVKFNEGGGGDILHRLINSGLYLMETSVLDEIPNKIPCSLELDFFPQMIGNGIYGYKTNGKFIDIGTPESYAKGEVFFDQKSDLP